MAIRKLESGWKHISEQSIMLGKKITRVTHGVNLTQLRWLMRSSPP